MILAIVSWLIVGVAGWRVYSRAGFTGAWGILFLVPIANIIVLLYLAHAEWPAKRKP